MLQTIADPALPAADLAHLTLVLGGARSGKSRYAEGLLPAGTARLYVATSEAADAEMAERIRLHRERRDAGWVTVEAPLELAETLDAMPAVPALVDCLTLWLSNLMHAGRDIDAEAAALARILAHRSAATVLVANEVGLGIVPDNALARAFRDAAGRLNQKMAALAGRVVFVAAGLPLTLKQPAHKGSP